jgi:3-deoxy-D-manno-octulosonic-acid transferase
MARSLGFAAYRALSRRKSRSALAPHHPRPDGDVLWLHATSADRLVTLGELGARVRSQRNDLVVLITCEHDVAGVQPVMQTLEGSGVQVDRFTSDHPEDAQDFLDHWKPDICLWAGAGLMPNLISQAADRAVPMILIDVGQDDISLRKHKWFPALTRSSLGRFEIIMTNDGAAANMLRRIGVPGSKITIAEPLRNGPSPPTLDEEDITDTSQQLTGRPLWLAAHAQPDEYDLILAAHRGALKLIHRLLLVLTVKDPDALGKLDGKLKSADLRFVWWQVGDEIDDNTQVLISDGTEDLGLWYRMAPLTFMASSLTGSHTGQSPLAAMALGSAILFGPHVQNHRETYSRLAAAGAARSVGDAEGLASAVIRLVAPDHAAAMALAGWQVVTEGAELTDRLVELVQDRLDMKGAGNARA